MKLAGMGRILLWSGGSLWIGRSGTATDVHSHHAVQISLALPQRQLRLCCPGKDWHSYSAAIIKANLPHAFDGAGELVANVFVEPESRAGQALQHYCSATEITVIDAEIFKHEIAALFAAYSNNADDLTFVAAARGVINKLSATTSDPPVALDPRIKRALELIRTRIGATVMLADIAAAVFLSPDRFRHLFQEQTGIRFRPYIQWLRIEIALAAYAAHRSLTEAAQEGGFADSAHFSRTFKSMFGVAPSSIHID